MGGLLADPVASYPGLFGPNSSFGGETGVQWLIKYPYALPMIANFVFLSFCAGCVAIGLEEVCPLCLDLVYCADFARRWMLAKASRVQAPF